MYVDGRRMLVSTGIDTTGGDGAIHIGGGTGDSTLEFTAVRAYGWALSHDQVRDLYIEGVDAGEESSEPFVCLPSSLMTGTKFSCKPRGVE